MSINSTNPLASVIIIFFDEEEFIEQAIASVFSQTYENWEIILVDDGSTDRSTAIAKRHAANYPAKVTYVEHEGHRNRGMGASRNAGLRSANGKYVGLLDADDVWLPRKLERQVALLEAEPHVAMVFGPTKCWFSWSGRSEDAECDFTLSTNSPTGRVIEAPERLLACYPLGADRTPLPCSVLMRRDCLEQLGGFEERFRGWFEDLAFFAKIHLDMPVRASDECLALYRIHERSYVSRVSKAGAFDFHMREFIGWLEEYLRLRGVGEREIWRRVAKARRRHEHPRLFAALDKALGWRKIPRRMAMGLADDAVNPRRILLGQARGRIEADPNPIIVSGLYARRFPDIAAGSTTLSWSTDALGSVEIRVNAPDGPLLTRQAVQGSITTGKWLHERTTFYLQDASRKIPTSRGSTLAMVRVNVMVDGDRRREA